MKRGMVRLIPLFGKMHANKIKTKNTTTSSAVQVGGTVTKRRKRKAQAWLNLIPKGPAYLFEE